LILSAKILQLAVGVVYVEGGLGKAYFLLRGLTVSVIYVATQHHIQLTVGRLASKMDRWICPPQLTHNRWADFPPDITKGKGHV
jgi:hypothetical protein